ncbi:MAG: hypothetical protein EOO41_05415, partial [Methanobacteriota archaeon]
MTTACLLAARACAESTVASSRGISQANVDPSATTVDVDDSQYSPPKLQVEQDRVPLVVGVSCACAFVLAVALLFAVRLARRRRRQAAAIAASMRAAAGN